MTPESPRPGLEVILDRLVQRLASLEGYLGQCWPSADQETDP